MCVRALLHTELSANEEMYDAGLLDSDNVFRGAEALRCPHLTAEVTVLFRGSERRRLGTADERSSCTTFLRLALHSLPHLLRCRCD
jgi:hypothetical protein